MTVALIAGQGRLPALLANGLHAAGKPVVVCELQGFPSGAKPVDLPFRLEHLGTLFHDLKERGVRQVCFAGAVARPRLDPTAIDARTAPMVETFLAAMKQGDDGALRAILMLFVQAGFQIVGAHEVLPALLPTEGVLTRAKPDDAAGADAARGMAIVQALGTVDVGQSCVVSTGQALAIEALPGTDWMLRSLKSRPGHLPAGGLLYKAPKPGQERRVDLPAIGPDTIRAAAAAELTGVVIEEGGVIVLDLAATVAAADEAGLFLWVRAPGAAG